MHRSNYEARDFAMDFYFQKWVQSPDFESNIYWETWVRNNPEKKKTIEEARRLVLLMEFSNEDTSSSFISSIWDNIEAGIEENNEIEIARTSFKKYYLAAAAVILLLISFGGYWSMIQYSSIEDLATAYGETRTITLPDSTKVTLNSNSEIKYNKDIDKNQKREVWLKGEAFFSVSHKSNNAKFIVYSNSVQVEVLGTEFNVNNRRSKTKVVLSTGKVKLTSAKKNPTAAVIMKPGEMVEVSESGSKIEKTLVNPDEYSSWRKKVLVFNKTSLAEIADLLEDNYGYKVDFEEKALASFTFSATIHLEKDNLHILFDLLKESFKIKMEQNGKKLTIKKER